MNKSADVNIAVFQIKKVIKDIRDFSGDWRHTDTFERFIDILNTHTKQLNLPTFNFEKFHYSSTGKTINEVGYNSIVNHIDILEEMISDNVDNYQINYEKTVRKNKNTDKKKVFVVHGRDRETLLETEGILTRAGLEPIVLNRMTNNGLTLIEKFEKYSDVSYAIVLLTPDDVGALYEHGIQFQSLSIHFRARQNVLFELGFFYGKLGRANVCCLLKQSVEKPTDIDGIAYIPFNHSVEEVEYPLLREMKEAKLDLRII